MRHVTEYSKQELNDMLKELTTYSSRKPRN